MVKYNEDVGELHRTDANGNRIKLRFATMLARKNDPVRTKRVKIPTLRWFTVLLSVSIFLSKGCEINHSSRSF